MEYVLLILGFICVIGGIVGSFLPILPDAPLSWIGLLLLYFCDGIETEYWTLGITLFIAIVAGILDYVIPAKGTKQFGGSSYGIWGTNIGLIVGILAPIPFGVIIGPFVGALVGEQPVEQRKPVAHRAVRHARTSSRPAAPVKLPLSTTAMKVSMLRSLSIFQTPG